jgi:hypothetical protein
MAVPPADPVSLQEQTIRPDAWGAQVVAAPFEACGEVRRIILHHTAIRDPALIDAHPSAEAAYMRRIERLHLERGWLAVGYHFVIMPSGRVFAGRPTWALGSHVSGHNEGAAGISLAGNFEEERPEQAALRSLAALRLGLARQGDTLPLIAHGDLKATLCPGRRLREALAAELRRTMRA